MIRYLRIDIHAPVVPNCESCEDQLSSGYILVNDKKIFLCDNDRRRLRNMLITMENDENEEIRSIGVGPYNEFD